MDKVRMFRRRFMRRPIHFKVRNFSKNRISNEFSGLVKGLKEEQDFGIQAVALDE